MENNMHNFIDAAAQEAAAQSAVQQPQVSAEPEQDLALRLQQDFDPERSALSVVTPSK